MKDLPIRNIFLPATIAGVAIFSSLAYSLPTFMNRYTQSADANVTRADLPARVDLTGLHKELAIAYIGGAMVLSASAGMGVAELLRRFSKKDQNVPDLKAALAEFMEAQDSVDNPESEIQLATLLANFTTDTLTAIDSTAIATNTTNNYQFPGDLPEAAWQIAYNNDETTPTAELAEMSAQATDNTVMIFPGQYQRCRIQLPGLQQHQYAIAFNDKFYCLLNSGLTKEDALSTVKQLAQENHAAILTPMNQGYAIWVMATDAALVSVA